MASAAASTAAAAPGPASVEPPAADAAEVCTSAPNPPAPLLHALLLEVVAAVAGSGGVLAIEPVGEWLGVYGLHPHHPPQPALAALPGWHDVDHVGDVMARGGQGAVFFGTVLGRQVAIKVPLPAHPVRACF